MSDEPQYWGMKFSVELLREKQAPTIVADMARRGVLKFQHREGLVDEHGQWIGGGDSSGPAVRDNAPNA